MTAYMTPVMMWWEARAPRERLLLAVLLIVLAVWLIVVAVWQPLQSARQHLGDQIARHDRALSVLQSQPVTAAPETVTDGRPLANVITDSVGAFQLTIRRLEPEGSRVRVVLEDAPFDAVILWLETVQRDQGLRVSEIEMTRRPAPGVVNAVLALER